MLPIKRNVIFQILVWTLEKLNGYRSLGHRYVKNTKIEKYRTFVLRRFRQVIDFVEKKRK